MNRNLSLGPRGWAILTLAGGAALASPFLRPAQLKKHPDAIELDARGVASAFPEGFESVAPGALAESFRVVSQERPSTLSADQLPAWASKKSRLDDMISSQLATTGLPSNVVAESQRPQELQPWLNDASPRVQSGVQSPDQAIASNRYSPWQSAETQGDVPEPTRGADAMRYADTNWHVETPDVRALLQETSIASNSAAPQPNQQPGALVGATVGASLRSVVSGKSEAPARQKPKFVFQPGMKAADR